MYSNLMKSLLTANLRMAFRMANPLPVRAFTGIMNMKDYMPKPENIEKVNKINKKKDDESTTTTSTTSDGTTTTTTSEWEEEEELIPEIPKSLEDEWTEDEYDRPI